MSYDEMATWLTGVLDEVKRVAKAAMADRANPPGWGFDDDDFGLWDVQSDEDGYGHFRRASVFTEGGLTVANMADPDGNAPTAAHIALHDPRAVLARVEAERAILNLEMDPYVASDIDGQDPATARVGYEVAQREAIRWLAYGHRFDAPGYDPAWAPEDIS